jgi:hypothetical protein
MRSIQKETDLPAGATMTTEPGEETPSGIRPARDGVQPIRDLASFLQLLPDFGETVAELSDAIAESRTLRRAAAEVQDC